MNKSLSDTNVADCASSGFMYQRSKRGREQLEYESDLSDFKDEMKAFISNLMASQQEEIKKINVNIENCMALLTAQNEELRKKIEKIENQAKRDKEYITILEDKVEDLQRGSRKANLEIKNVPKVTKESKEDLVKMVTKLSENLGCSIDHTDIKDIYRVQNKRDTKNSPIVVELASTMQKAEFLKMAKNFNIKHKEKLCAKHIGFTTNEYTPIYVSEQLTAKGARLFFLARDLAKSKSYKFCWSAYGRIYVRKNENTPIIHVTGENQICSLLKQE